MANPLNVDAVALLQKQGLPMNANNLNRAMNMLAGADPVAGGSFDLGQDAPPAAQPQQVAQQMPGPPPPKPPVPPSQVQPSAGGDDATPGPSLADGDADSGLGTGLLGMLTSLLGLHAVTKGGGKGGVPGKGGIDGDILGPEAPKQIVNRAEPTTLEARYDGTDAPQVAGPSDKIKRIGTLEADRTANGGEPYAGSPSRSFQSINEDSMTKALEDHGGPTNVTPAGAPQQKVIPMPDNVQGGRVQNFVRSLKPAELDELAKVMAKFIR